MFNNTMKKSLERFFRLLVTGAAMLCILVFGLLPVTGKALDAETAAIQAEQAAKLASFHSRGQSVSGKLPTAPKSILKNREVPSVSSEKSETAAHPVSASPAGQYYTKMKTWKDTNSDVIGYLYIPGTNIDYPVVWASSNKYYEHLNIYKQYSRNGVIWADQDVTSKSRNTVIYGHNWTNYSASPRINNPNDVMFAQLTAYQYSSFAQSHSTIKYANEDGEGTYKVFGAIYTTDLNYYFNTNLSATTLYKQAKQNGLYCFDMDVQDSDKILTLSTCTRYLGQFADQRFVVLARKLRLNETFS